MEGVSNEKGRKFDTVCNEVIPLKETLIIKLIKINKEKKGITFEAYQYVYQKTIVVLSIRSFILQSFSCKEKRNHIFSILKYFFARDSSGYETSDNSQTPNRT